LIGEESGEQRAEGGEQRADKSGSRIPVTTPNVLTDFR